MKSFEKEVEFAKIHDSFSEYKNERVTTCKQTWNCGFSDSFRFRWFFRKRGCRRETKRDSLRWRVNLVVVLHHRGCWWKQQRRFMRWSVEFIALHHRSCRWKQHWSSLRWSADFFGLHHRGYIWKQQRRFLGRTIIFVILHTVVISIFFTSNKFLSSISTFSLKRKSQIIFKAKQN